MGLPKSPLEFLFSEDSLGSEVAFFDIAAVKVILCFIFLVCLLFELEDFFKAFLWELIEAIVFVNFAVKVWNQEFGNQEVCNVGDKLEFYHPKNIIVAQGLPWSSLDFETNELKSFV